MVRYARRLCTGRVFPLRMRTTPPLLSLTRSIHSSRSKLHRRMQWPSSHPLLREGTRNCTQASPESIPSLVCRVLSCPWSPVQVSPGAGIITGGGEAHVTLSIQPPVNAGRDSVTRRLRGSNASVTSAGVGGMGGGYSCSDSGNNAHESVLLMSVTTWGTAGVDARRHRFCLAFPSHMSVL